MRRYVLSLASSLIFTFFTILLGNAGTAEAYTLAQQQMIDQKADAIINTAADLIGKATYNNSVYKDTYPYQFGCGGYVYYVFKQNGIDLLTRNNNHMIYMGTYVPKSQLKKGDLVFFDSQPDSGGPSTHVAIYYGNNKVIHMADSKLNVVISDLSGSYYTKYYVTARRVIPGYLPLDPKTKADELVDYAESLKGSYFGSGRFVDAVYKQFGIDLGTVYPSKQAQLGTEVSKEELQKGDLVFFSTEQYPNSIILAGIYAGNQQVILSTVNGGQAKVVKVLLVYDFYKNHYMTARRIPVTTTEENNSPTSTKADELVDYAESLKGSYFGSGRFVDAVYKQFGIDLGTVYPSKQAQLGTEVPKEELQKGDLVFFSTEQYPNSIILAGIYAGNQQVILSTVNGGQAKVVKVSLVYDFYKNHYMTARRIAVTT